MTGGYSGLCGDGCCPSCQTAWGSWLGCFCFVLFCFLFFPAFIDLMGHLVPVRALKWSHQIAGLWAVFDYFCPHGQVATGTCDTTLPVCARWSDLLLLFPGGSSVVLQLCLWLVSSSSSKVGQFSFVCHSQSHEISSTINHTPTLGGWLVIPPSLSTFVPCSTPAS
jgi:hypothetical protein